MEAIESTYFDTCEVLRMVDTLQTNGSYKQQRQVVYSNVSCAFSQGTRPSTSSITEGSYKKDEVLNEVQTQDKLYLNPSYIIKQGDLLRISHLGRVVNTTAGFPFIYDSHQVLYVEGTSYA